MKFKADKDTLIKEILIAHEIISGTNIISILSNVLLETVSNTLKIQATDLKVSFETQIPVDTEEPGSTTIMCDKFLSILRSLPSGEIDFEQVDTRLHIMRKEEKINFKLRCISPQDFPQFEIPNEQTLTVPSRDFVEMIDQTIISVSDDETRYYMNGIYFEPGQQSIIMVATDGRKLSFIDRGIEGQVPFFEPVIIPPKFMGIIRKISSKEGVIALTITDTHIYANFDSHYISSTLIEGKFPNYKRVIPLHQPNVCVIKTHDIYEAFKRVSLLVDQKSRRIVIDIHDSTIVLSSEESDLGIAREELSCTYNGEQAKIIMNCSYIINALRVIRSEEVSFSFHDQTKAVTVRPNPEEDYFHIIMPMS